jgi:hypothetical protein
LPCYIVKDTDATAEGPKDRLVEAPNKASARNYATRTRFSVEIAQPADIQRVCKNGGEIEAATGADEVQEQTQPEAE